METPLRFTRDGLAGCACRAGAQGAGSAARFAFDLFSSISCEMTRDEIIFVFCDARVSCKWEKMAIIQRAYCNAGGNLAFKDQEDSPETCFRSRPSAPHLTPPLCARKGRKPGSVCETLIYSGTFF